MTRVEDRTKRNVSNGVFKARRVSIEFDRNRAA